MIQKVIFVGGTSFSGSTMLDMILANDPLGFSCGEVVNLFYPIKPHHINPWCGCGDPACDVWSQVRDAGVDNLYTKLSELFPDVSFVVDSSKNPCWISRQERLARSQGLDIEHVLIWKSPTGLARSFEKRGRLPKFESAYVNYHRRYNGRVAGWTGVQYEKLIQGPAILAQLCGRLGISMFDGKQDFWTKRHHTLFGNNSAKVSLFSGEHPRFEAIRNQREKFEGDGPASVVHHRSIFYHGRQGGSEPSGASRLHLDRLDHIAGALDMRSLGGSSAAEVGGSTEVRLPAAGRIESTIRCALFAARRYFRPVRQRQS